uniref:Immunoglobulin V-set domain-containing protein n=1 Tax=Astatotilapia calliptera TaxID=8154 RepID=A0A3P8QTJ4_ASTCA
MSCCSSATLTCHLTLFIFLTDSCCDTVTKVQSYEGYSESVSCPYESQYQNSLKYICRGNRPSTCLQQALITSDTKQNGRFRLDDDKVSGTFTVTINSLVKTDDTGTYWCGSDSQWMLLISVVRSNILPLHKLWILFGTSYSFMAKQSVCTRGQQQISIKRNIITKDNMQDNMWFTLCPPCCWYLYVSLCL